MGAVLTGIDNLMAKIDEQTREYAKAKARGVAKACLIVEGYAKEHMSPESPSSPGNPPAVVTGTLRAAITHQVVEEGENVVGYVGLPSSVPYAEWLEFGTSKMAPRPFLNPALKINREAVREAIREELEE